MSAQENTASRRRGPRMGHGPGMGPVEKPKDLKGTLRKLVAFMARYKVPIIVVFVFAMASTIFNIIGPKVLSTATTELFEGIVGKIQERAASTERHLADTHGHHGPLPDIRGVLVCARVDHELGLAANLL